MDEHKIKSAMKSQLDSIEMDKCLKEKTMRALAQHTTNTYRLRWPFIGSGLGVIALCIMAFVLIRSNEINERPTPIAILSEEVNNHVRQVESPLQRLTMIMNQLDLSYSIEPSKIESTYTVIPIVIEERESYYVELSETVDKYDICQNSSYTIIQFDEQHLFLYTGSKDELIQSLIVNGTLICK